MLWLKNAITHLSGWMDDPLILGTSELRVAEGKRQVMNMVTSSSLCLYPSLISVLGILFLLQGCTDHPVACVKQLINGNSSQSCLIYEAREQAETLRSSRKIRWDQAASSI